MAGRNTRESQGGLPAQLALCIAGGTPEVGIYTSELPVKIDKLFDYLSLNDKYSSFFDTTGYGEMFLHKMPPEGIPANFQFEQGGRELVGILCSFYGIPHNIPYVRIGGVWYNGDNEFGYLRRMINLPNVNFRYTDPYGVTHANVGIKSYIGIYCDSSQIGERSRERTGDMSGFPTFGQSRNSCISDSLQTVLMQADGLYDFFNKNLFTEFKAKYSEPLTRFISMERTPYTKDELDGFISSVNILSFTPTDPSNVELYKYILYMFIRFASFELLPKRTYRMMTDDSDIEKMWYIKLLNKVRLEGNIKFDLSSKTNIPDSDFIIFAGMTEFIDEVILVNCTQLTDRAFEYFQGIKKININGCNNPGLTSAAFRNFRGVKKLQMAGCNQPTIGDEAFSNLRGIEELLMRGCNQPTITDEIFQFLTGIRTLNMVGCNQEGMTGKNMKLLGNNLKLLQINKCNPSLIEAGKRIYGLEDMWQVSKYNLQGGSRRKRNGKKTRKAKKKL